MALLAIETSCDECSAAVVSAGTANDQVKVHSNAIFTQIDLHRAFGGIVPEIASRSHLDMFNPVINEALAKAGIQFSDLEAIAVTQGPGLIGALLVGLSAAKAMAYSLDIPLISVDHLDGHLHSLFIESQKNCRITSANLPLLVCLVSGGHTNLYLLKSLPPGAVRFEKLSDSRDDAAGEAFDKSAKIMGLPYPGGVHIDRISTSGNPKAYVFPKPMPGKNLEFSFSGFKTAVLNKVKELGYEPYVFGAVHPEKLPQGQILADLCASIQHAIVGTLVKKIELAIEMTGAKGLAIVGGVSANSELRKTLNERVKIPVFSPDPVYCTDNAAMIGASGWFKYKRGEILSNKELLSLNAYSS